MRLFTAGQTAAALPYHQLVPAIAVAALELASGKLRAPERQIVPLAGGGVLLCMPATASDIGVTKLVTVHTDNARHGLPVIQGEVVVFDTATGQRLALLDGPTVTARRTAAVTLLGIQTLLPRVPESALIIGTGVQALAHVTALIEFFGIVRFHVAARDFAKTAQFCAALRQRYPQISAVPVDSAMLEHHLPHTDLVIALTTSRMPVIPAHIAASTLAIGVGAFKPDMVEFPAALLHARQIVVDDLEGAHHEAGDLIQARIDWTAVRGLASMLSGDVAVTPVVPVFKTVGQAAWDLAAARVVLAGVR
ncbi:delta(1)-pyrroline-2-carboxylate reductase family protein [Actimicrobium antarcticum]|uniref:Delta(1)-pyrroline-2-carboxylate reductase family protein n=1 Tax=Actimicrobium antarcticum TaxID=1051899 RepID=A0ABP7SYQ5_9BURK